MFAAIRYGAHTSGAVSGLGRRARCSSKGALQQKSYSSDSDSTGDGRSQPRSSHALSEAEFEHQLELRSPADILRRQLLGPRAKLRAVSINNQQRLLQFRKGHRLESLEDHFDRDTVAVRFRPNSTDEHDAVTVSMDLLRFQIKACSSPEDVTRVLTVASQNEHCMHLLGTSNMQLLLSCVLENFEPNRVLVTLNKALLRFQAANVELELPMIFLALRRAALVFNLAALRRWLLVLRRYTTAVRWGLKLDDDCFRPILDAFNQGYSNATPKHREAIEACIGGFPDAPNPHDSYHLGSFMRFYRLRTYSSWIDLLLKLSLPHHIAKTWPALRKSGSLREGRTLSITAFKQHRSFVVGHVMLAMFQIQLHDQAWRVFEEAGLYVQPDHPLWSQMLHEGLHDPLSSLPDSIRLKPELARRLSHLVFNQLERRLEDIERNLQVVWVKPRNTSIQPYHSFFYEARDRQSDGAGVSARG